MAVNDSIHIDPDALEEIAGQFAALSREFDDDTNKARNLVNELTSEWTGRASEAFANEFADLEPNLLRVGELMEQISRQLKGVVSAFREGDDSIANRIHV